MKEENTCHLRYYFFTSNTTQKQQYLKAYDDLGFVKLQISFMQWSLQITFSFVIVLGELP